MKTLIEGRFVVAFDGSEHRLIGNGVVVVEGSKIVHVGKSYTGTVDKRIDATNKVVIPGLINIHCHASSPLTKSLRGDVSNRQLYNSDLFDRFILMPTTSEEDLLSAEFTYAELLRGGCTTIVDCGLGGWPNDQAVKLAEKIGIRAYLLKEYNSGYWKTNDGKRVFFDNFDGEKWNDEPGLKELEKAVDYIREINGKYGDRIRSMLHPGTQLTCSPSLLRETRRLANELKTVIQIHVAESVLEFHETLRRYAKTPIEVLADTGLLGPDLIVAHALFIAGHSKVGYPDPWEKDIQLIANSHTSVAHCPVTFSRSGVGLESYSKYLRAGINVGIGTDTFPQDMFREMNAASTISKIKEQEVAVATCRDVFDSATISGAKALGRNDIGRIQVGAKADIAIINLHTFNMSPLRDPIRNLVMCATRNDVDMVMVDGRIVVEDGVVTSVNENNLATRMQSAAEKLWERWQEVDPRHRSIDDMTPLSLKYWID